MNIDTQQAQLQAQISNVSENKYLSKQQKQQRISLLRSSRPLGTDTSFKTITSLANTMIGSAIIVYPILFVKDGMFGSTLIMLVVGCVQFVTCRLLVVHNKPEQQLFNDSILRIGGVKLSILNSLTNAFLLFFVSIAYFLLIAVNFFQVSVAIIKAIKTYDPPPIDTIDFQSYSIQWACIICALLCLPTIFKRDIESILAIVKYSLYPVVAYAVFIVICLIREIAEGRIDFSQYKKFDPDFSNVAGAFALSFLIHPTAAPILKKNIDLRKNERDLLWGYVLTALIYFYVGFIGGLTCASEVKNINENPSLYTNIFDCVARHQTTEQKIFYIVGKIVQLGIFFQNYSVMPVLFFLTRNQVIALNAQKNKQKIFKGFTIIFIIVACLFGVLAIDVSLVMSFTGAIVGFFMGYFIPIYTHLRCYHHKFSPKENKRRRSLLSSEIDDELTEGMQLDDETQAAILQCNDHPPKSKTIHYLFYGGIIALGVALGIFKIVSFFEG